MSRTRRDLRGNDLRDEARAVHMRNELGRDGWLVSWNLEPFDEWRARVSCRSLEETFEAFGRTRCSAIRKASLRLLDKFAEVQARDQGIAWYDDAEGEEDPESESDSSDMWWRGDE